MLRKLLRLIFSSFVVISCSGNAQAAELSSYRIGAWTVGAFTDDSTGQFSHCASLAPYVHGTSLLFAIDKKFAWSMGFSNDEWNLRVGDQYSIRYNVDNGPTLYGTAVAVTNRLARVELLDSSALFKLFQAGHVLRVFAEGQQFTFSLKDSSKSLEATFRCAERQVAQDDRQNPFSSKPDVPNERVETASFKAEAAAVAANLLSKAGVAQFELAPVVPKDLDMFHAAWTAPGLYGGLLIDPTADIDAAGGELVGAGARNCRGKFASAKLPSPNSNSASLKTVCDADGKSASITYILLRRPAGGLYVMAVANDPTTGPSSTENSGTVEDATGRLMDASQDIR